MTEIKVGNKVLAINMPISSFYKQVVGNVTEVNGEWISINATLVMSKWDDEFEEHPTSCTVSVKRSNVSII
jgi:hypothetical protein